MLSFEESLKIIDPTGLSADYWCQKVHHFWPPLSPFWSFIIKGIIDGKGAETCIYQSISLLIILRAQNEVNLQGHAYRIACNVYIKMIIMNAYQFHND